MPKLASTLYASYRESVLKLAAMEGGVSRPQIMESLGVSRAVADTMIEKCSLKVQRKEGRTEFFVVPKGGATSQSVAATPAAVTATEEVDDDHVAPDGLPPDVDLAVMVEPNALDRLADVVETDDQVIATVDAEIAKTRKLLTATATLAGKAMGEWLSHQSVVDSLREKMQELVSRRLTLSA